MAQPGFGYVPISGKEEKGDIESASGPPFPPTTYSSPPGYPGTYHSPAPSGYAYPQTGSPYYPPPPGYQPVAPHAAQYAPQYTPYGYPPQGPPHTSDYPVIGSYQPGPDAFTEVQIRQGFIRKVFGLVTIQVLLTTAIAAVICFSHDVRDQLRNHPGLFWLAMGASISVMLVLSCSESVRRRYPLNLLLLFGFTAAEGLLIGLVSSQYNTQIVVLALAMTATITACLAVYALQSRYDFTTMGGVLFSTGFTLVAVSVIYLFFPYWKPAELLISGVGALLFAGYIVYDIQSLMGGEHAVQVSPEEYIFAAMHIYMDIINLFLYILRFLQALNDD